MFLQAATYIFVKRWCKVTVFSLFSLLMILSDVVKVVNLQGKLKSSKRQASELHFDFTVSYIGKYYLISPRYAKLNNFIWSVCLTDSVLAFHRQGMQGRSFKNNEVTQEICDKSTIFKLVGSDRYVYPKLQ